MTCYRLLVPCHIVKEYVRSCDCPPRCLVSHLCGNTARVNAHTTIPSPPPKSRLPVCWEILSKEKPYCCWAGPSGVGETQQIKILGEDTQADLERSEIQAQETHLSQKAFQIHI